MSCGSGTEFTQPVSQDVNEIFLSGITKLSITLFCLSVFGLKPGVESFSLAAFGGQDKINEEMRV